MLTIANKTPLWPDGGEGTWIPNLLMGGEVAMAVLFWRRFPGFGLEQSSWRYGPKERVKRSGTVSAGAIAL